MAAIELASPGLHHLILTVRWETNTSNARMTQLTVERDGDVVGDVLTWDVPAGPGWCTQQVSLYHIAQPGDLVVPIVRQNSGADLDVKTFRTQLQIARLAQ